MWQPFPDAGPHTTKLLSDARVTLFLFLRSRHVPRDIAEDCVSEALLSISKYFDEGRIWVDKDHYRNTLYHIARNKLIDRMRRDAREKQTTHSLQTEGQIDIEARCFHPKKNVLDQSRNNLRLKTKAVFARKPNLTEKQRKHDCEEKYFLRCVLPHADRLTRGATGLSNLAIAEITGWPLAKVIAVRARLMRTKPTERMEQGS